MPTIVHFEIPADQPERAITFYQTLFGWKFEKFEGMDYWSITTSGDHPVGGGMLQRRAPDHSVTNYVDVNGIDESLEKVKQLGGKMIMGKTAVPKMGYFAFCLDTENNPFGLWQSDANAS